MTGKMPRVEKAWLCPADMSLGAFPSTPHRPQKKMVNKL
jgi:hypothetical protein